MRMHPFHLFPTIALARKYHTEEKTIPLCHIYATSVTRYIERTELRSRRKGICRTWSTFLSLLACLRGQLSESDLGAEISVAIVEVRRSGNGSRSTVVFSVRTCVHSYILSLCVDTIWEKHRFPFVIDNDLWANRR